MSSLPSWDADASGPFRITFKIQRAFKALDDGKRRKWVLVVRLQDLPATFPLDANARIPNVIKNKTCSEMRATLLSNPELFQVFNGGVVCTADQLEIRQVESAMYADVTFDSSRSQGIVNGGHSYAAALHVGHGVTSYSDGKELASVLADDIRKGQSELSKFVDNPDILSERIAKARHDACIQIELVAPVENADLLEQIARARNLSQSVEDTALANLAGKFDQMKETLAAAFGPGFVQRVIWKTNQEIPEGSRNIPVKLLLQILALMNVQIYQPGMRSANEVYSRSGLVIRDFIEAQGEREEFYKRLVSALPAFLELYDHIYLGIVESDPHYPWATGKLGEDARRRGYFTPIFAHACESRVSHAFVWPVFAAFRSIICSPEPKNGLHWQVDPFQLFDEKRQELIEKVKSFHQNQAHGIVQQVGKDKELWLRLESLLELELNLRKRLGTLGNSTQCKANKHPKEEGDTESEVAENSSDGYTNRRPVRCIFKGQPVACTTWKDIYVGVAMLLAKRHNDFETRVQEIKGRERPYFSTFRNGMNTPKRLDGTKLFMETCFSANETVKRTLNLIKHFGYAESDLLVE